MSAMLLCAPVGIFIGFSGTASFSYHLTWEWTFWILSGVSFLCSLVTMFLPSKFFDCQKANEYRRKCERKVNESLEEKD